MDRPPPRVRVEDARLGLGADPAARRPLPRGVGAPARREPYGPVVLAEGPSGSERTSGRGLGPAGTRSGLTGATRPKPRAAQAARTALASKAVSPGTTTSAPAGTAGAPTNSAASSTRVLQARPRAAQWPLVW